MYGKFVEPTDVPYAVRHIAKVFCKEIRQFSDVHILIFSAVGEPKLVAKALFAGADYFLAKPTPITVLAEYINKIVNSASVDMITMSASIQMMG